MSRSESFIWFLSLYKGREYSFMLNLFFFGLLSKWSDHLMVACLRHLASGKTRYHARVLLIRMRHHLKCALMTHLHEPVGASFRLDLCNSCKSLWRS